MVEKQKLIERILKLTDKQFGELTRLLEGANEK